MAVGNEIKDQIIAKIEALDTVQVVLPAENLTPKGYPAVFVKSTDIDSEFSSNSHNSRTYAYRITIAMPIGSDFVPESEANRLDYSERVINDVVEGVLNQIEGDYELDTPVLFAKAIDSLWDFVEQEVGVVEICQLTCQIYTEKEVNPQS